MCIALVSKAHGRYYCSHGVSDKYYCPCNRDPSEVPLGPVAAAYTFSGAGRDLVGLLLSKASGLWVFDWQCTLF